MYALWLLLCSLLRSIHSALYIYIHMYFGSRDIYHNVVDTCNMSSHNQLNYDSSYIFSMFIKIKREQKWPSVINYDKKGSWAIGKVIPSLIHIEYRIYLIVLIYLIIIFPHIFGRFEQSKNFSRVRHKDDYYHCSNVDFLMYERCCTKWRPKNI